MTPATAHAGAAAKASWTWASSIAMTVSVGAHFAIFAWNPVFNAGDFSHTSTELQAIDMMPPELEIPPPPEAIARPATPVISNAVIDENITIAATTFEANPISSLPPPPAASSSDDADLRAAPQFTPYTIRPELKNPDVVRDVLMRAYPPMLRNAGIGGTVLLWVFLDDEGVVQRSIVKVSSGFPPLDEAGLSVAPEMKFTPAINRDRKVPVWIELPLIFSVR